MWSFHEVQKAFIVDSLPQTLSILGVEQHDYCDSEIELQMQTYIFHPLLHYDFSWSGPNQHNMYVYTRSLNNALQLFRDQSTVQMSSKYCAIQMIIVDKSTSY